MNEESENILARFVAGKCTVEEELLLQERLASDEKFRIEYANLKDIHFLVSQIDRLEKPESQAINEIFNRTIDRKKKRMFNVRSYYKYVAVILVLLVVGVVFFYTKEKYWAGDEMMICAVPDGKRQRIVLPDSSVVWLNGGSTIRYAQDFGKQERLVELDGEAYFEVTHNLKVPFVVDLLDFQIKVFGTKFNVNSYSEDEQVETTLDEGSIGIRLKSKGSDFLNLKSREKVILNRKSQKMTKELSIDTHSWKDGYLIFSQDNIETIVKKIERWYGVEIKVDSVKNNSYLYTGTFSAESLEDLLEAVDFLTPITYTITSNEVRISFR